MPSLEGIQQCVAAWGRRYPGVACVYVFGSQAKGTATERSDLDLAVEVDLSELINNRRAWSTELERELQIEVHIYPADGSVVADAVRQHGICIYRRIG